MTTIISPIVRMLSGAILLALTTAPALEAQCKPSDSLRVLFIGNSLTYAHNVPRMLEAVAAGLNGPCMSTEMIAIGSATLEDHWGADSVRQRIRSGRWTHVVLNDQSSFGEGWFVDGKSRMGSSGDALVRATTSFANLIRESGATPVLLAHWSDVDDPARDQQALDFAFTRAMRSSGVALSPVGHAVKRMQETLPQTTPYYSDGHHLSAEGAYLSALVHYGILTGRSPMGAASRISGPAIELDRGTVFRDSIVTLVDIPRPDASAIQNIAARAIRDGGGHWKSVREPPSLVSSFKQVRAGEAVTRARIAGRWRGESRFLPVPSPDPLTVEVVISADGSADSAYVRFPASRVRARGPTMFAGRAEVKFDSGIVVIHAPVAPNDGVPEFRLSLRRGILSGVAEVHIAGPGTRSFNSLGGVELRKVSSVPSGLM